MQYEFIVKEKSSGKVVAEGEFMARGSIDLIPPSDWVLALEAFVDASAMLAAMSPRQTHDFLSKFIGPEAAESYRKAA